MTATFSGQMSMSDGEAKLGTRLSQMPLAVRDWAQRNEHEEMTGLAQMGGAKHRALSL